MSAAGARIDALKAVAEVADVVGAGVVLNRAGRGECPFHGSKSESLAVYPDSGRWKCWGCDAGGDVIGFVQDFYGLDFKGALERLESDYGLAADRPRADGAGPVRRERAPHRPREVEVVGSDVVAAELMRRAVGDPASVGQWLAARRVPEAYRDARWLADVRFAAEAPYSPWPLGKGPDDVFRAAAMIGIMRTICHRPAAEGPASTDAAASPGVMPAGGVSPDGLGERGQRVMRAVGVHATYLSPGLRAKLKRTRSNGDALPSRKMFGPAGGAFVVLGSYRPDCPLFVGEGIETVLSGMAMLGAGPDACGLAVLSLGNLQGGAALVRVGKTPGVLPLHDPQLDASRPGVWFDHQGPVTGLIDADMKPLPGTLDRSTGRPQGVLLQERPGGLPLRRALSGADRADLCAALFVKGWRGAGCRQVKALRPRMGLDFNDMAKGLGQEMAA